MVSLVTYFKLMKRPEQLERHFKGMANHRRIEILFLVDRFDSIILEEIANRLKCNFKTISEHTRRLVQAGLLNKKYRGRSVTHHLSPYGRRFLRFAERFF